MYIASALIEVTFLVTDIPPPYADILPPTDTPFPVFELILPPTYTPSPYMLLLISPCHVKLPLTYIPRPSVAVIPPITLTHVPTGHSILPLTVILPVTIAVDSVCDPVSGSAYLAIISEPSVVEVGPT